MLRMARNSKLLILSNIRTCAFNDFMFNFYFIQMSTCTRIPSVLKTIENKWCYRVNIMLITKLTNIDLPT